MAVHRVLPAQPFTSIEEYIDAGGGSALRMAQRLEPDELIDLVSDSGLRGRGGGGFPTGTKWRTVAGFASDLLATSVVVNGAEGEPGTFKDRAILRANPYAVLEGALIAARAVDASTAVIAVKEAFADERKRLQEAIDELVAQGWVEPGVVSVFSGPREYLYGEETALLESVAGRPPFPRLAPPWRRGTVDVVRSDTDVGSDSGLAAPVVMAGTSDAPPALVNNVETIANVPGIVSRGPDWFRDFGTPDSPGTIVCTVSGSTKRAGVAELPMGTPLSEAIDEIGDGVEPGARVTAVLLGVASAAVPAVHLATPMTYETMQAIGSGLGAAGAIVLTDDVDLVAAAAGVARFLAVESCGQCTPCKRDGLAIADLLAECCASTPGPGPLDEVRERLTTVADGARCALAAQQQSAVGSLLDLAGDATRSEPAGPLLIAELIDIDDGQPVYDEGFLDKQPDWTFGTVDSGQTPVDRLTDRRVSEG